MHQRSAIVGMLLVLATLAAVGCGARAGGFRNEADELRARVQDLEDELARTRAERNELEGKVRELTSTLEAAGGATSADVVAALPRCAGLRFDRLCGLGDRDGEPGAETIDVYILPVDGRQRFLQVAGTLRVEATLHRPDGTSELLARRELGPRALREAYRSTLLSTHYTVDLPLRPPLAEDEAGTIVLVGQFQDAVTGLTHLATLTLE